jgi:hypothetical protein
VNFASDNTAPVAPAILDAIVEANNDFAAGYGDDDWTRSVERRLSELFEREVAAFLVPTGTAANALALAQVTPPAGVVFCHAEAHIATDECGAPEFFGGGLKLCGLAGAGGKITPHALKAALSSYGGHRPHQMIASALSLTQATEAGTIYRTEEIAALCDIAHARSLAVHVDGARFANALVRLNATPAQATWQAGIDVLSFGATKGGALAAEAVVLILNARRCSANGASAAAICCQSIDSLPRNLPLISPTTAGLRLRATRTPWLIVWRRSSRRRAWPRFGRSRPISSSLRCRARSMPSSRPPARIITCAGAKVYRSAPTRCWRGS